MKILNIFLLLVAFIGQYVFMVDGIASKVSKCRSSSWWGSAYFISLHCPNGKVMNIKSAVARPPSHRCGGHSYEKSITSDVMEECDGKHSCSWRLKKYRVPGCSRLTCHTVNYECVAATCGPLEDISNGKVMLSNDDRIVGTTATYTCNVNFLIHGDAIRHCGWDDTYYEYRWLGQPPSCYVDKTLCPHTTNTMYVIGPMCYEFHDEQQYNYTEAEQKCLEKHGSMAMVINNDIWSLVVQHAKMQWNIHHVQNTYWFKTDEDYIGHWYYEADKCFYFYLYITTHYYVKVFNWGWSTDCNHRGGHICQYEPIVATSCDPLEVPENGWMSGSSRAIGSEITLSCNDGYTPTNKNRTSFIRQCLPSGLWDGVHPDCQEVDCGYPTGGENVKIVLPNNATTFGAMAQFGCMKGFSHALVNDEDDVYIEAICQKDGQWSLNPPVCSVIVSTTSLPLTESETKPITSHGTIYVTTPETTVVTRPQTTDDTKPQTTDITRPKTTDITRPMPKTTVDTMPKMTSENMPRTIHTTATTTTTTTKPTGEISTTAEPQENSPIVGKHVGSGDLSSAHVIIIASVASVVLLIVVIAVIILSVCLYRRNARLKAENTRLRNNADYETPGPANISNPVYDGIVGAQGVSDPPPCYNIAMATTKVPLTPPTYAEINNIDNHTYANVAQNISQGNNSTVT